MAANPQNHVDTYSMFCVSYTVYICATEDHDCCILMRAYINTKRSTSRERCCNSSFWFAWNVSVWRFTILFVRVLGAHDGASAKHHLVLSEGASLVWEDVFNLSQVLGDVQGLALHAAVRLLIVQIDVIGDEEDLTNLHQLNGHVEGDGDQDLQRRGEEQKGKERRGEERRGEVMRRDKRRKWKKRRGEEQKGKERKGEERRGEKRRGDERRQKKERKEEESGGEGGEEQKRKKRRGKKWRGTERKGKKRRGEENG